MYLIINSLYCNFTIKLKSDNANYYKTKYRYIVNFLI